MFRGRLLFELFLVVVKKLFEKKSPDVDKALPGRIIFPVYEIGCRGEQGIFFRNLYRKVCCALLFNRFMTDFCDV